MFDGADITALRDFRRVRSGIGRSFQTPTVFDSLTVVDNLDLAATFRRRLPTLLRKRRSDVGPRLVDARAGRPRRRARRAGRRAQPRPEAVAGDRHAARPGAAAAAARRAGGGHERRGAGRHRRRCCTSSPAITRSSSSSTTWRSCAGSPGRHGAPRGARARRRHGGRGPGRTRSCARSTSAVPATSGRARQARRRRCRREPARSTTSPSPTAARKCCSACRSTCRTERWCA